MKFTRLFVQALKGHEKTLLPTLHLVWPAVGARLRDSEPLVVLRACETLAALVDAAPDFMQARAETCVN